LAAGLGGTAGTREKLAFNVGLSHYNGTTFLTEVLCLKWCDHSRIIRTLSKPRRLKIPYLALSKSPKRTYSGGLHVVVEAQNPPLSAVLPAYFVSSSIVK
jgi:hypothetical protein